METAYTYQSGRSIWRGLLISRYIFVGVTPELTLQEKVVFFELQNKNLKVLIEPLDEAPTETVSVKKNIESKSQSQKIRSLLFVLWKQNSEGIDEFEDYYYRKTENYIEHLKSKIEQ